MHTGETDGWNHPRPAQWHRPVFGLLLLAVAVNLSSAALNLGPEPSCSVALEGAPWTLAVISLGVGLARRLPLQNIVFASFGLLLASTALELLTAQTGVPFGLRRATAGGGCFGMPWFAPFIWAALTLSARGLARLMLKPFRQTRFYGLWVLGVAGALISSAWLAVVPVAAAGNWWEFHVPATALNWHGMPLLAQPAIAVAALLQLAFVTPWLLNKKPVRQPLDLHPLAVWVCLLGWLLARQAIAGMRGPMLPTVTLLTASVFATFWGIRTRQSVSSRQADWQATVTESD